MTDPGSDPSQQSPQTPPSPWNPRPAGPRPGGGGCSKPLLVGCGVFLLLLGVLAVAFLVKAPDFLHWWFGKLEAQILTQLPPDLPAVERDRLHNAFAAVDRAMKSGKLDPTGLQQVQTKLMEIAGKPNRRLTAQDVRELSTALERLAGKTPQPPPGG